MNNECKICKENKTYKTQPCQACMYALQAAIMDCADWSKESECVKYQMESE